MPRREPEIGNFPDLHYCKMLFGPRDGAEYPTLVTTQTGEVVIIERIHRYEFDANGERWVYKGVIECPGR